MIRMRIPQALQPEGHAEMVPSAPSSYEDVASRVRRAIEEILAMSLWESTQWSKLVKEETFR